jgi:hypothetical protein
MCDNGILAIASVLIRSLPSLGGPGAAGTQYLAPIRHPSPSKPFHYITHPHTTHALVHCISPPLRLRPITITQRTHARRTTRALARSPSRASNSLADITRFLSCRPSPTQFRLRSLALGRWTTHTVLVSSSHSCVLQKLSHCFAGSSAVQGCQLVTLLPPQGYSSRVAPRYGADRSRWTAITFALGYRCIRYTTSFIWVIML